MDPPYVGHLLMIRGEKKNSVRIRFNFRLKECEEIVLECMLKSIPQMFNRIKI